jgi:hypothetical protein
MASKKKNDYNGTIVTINKNGEVVRTTPETTNKTVTKVNSNTSNLVSKPTVEAKQTVKMPTINTQEKANKNYEEKLSLFNKATEDLENKRINELNKRNIDLTRRLDKQDYKSQTQNGRVTDKRTLQEQQRQYDAFAPKLAELTQNEEQNRLNAQNDLRLATYQKDLADVEADDIGLLDKITNPFLSGIANVFSPITDENKYIDENGNEIYLPTRNDLKYQKVRESYGNGFLGNLARFGGDVTQEFGKQAATQAVDALTFGIGGKALYFTDIVSDQYKQNINEGYDQQTSLKDAILKGASNYVKQKLMGGLAGKLTGNTSALENTLTNTFAKAVNNPRVVSMLSSMGAEALDEFTDTYVEAGIDAAVLGKKVNADELFLDALYSSAIGGATGAGSGALNVSPEARQAVIDRQLNNQNNQVQNTQPTTQTETPQIEANKVEQTNTQPRLEQQQMSLNETNNEPTRSNEQIEQDLIREINKEQQKLDTGKSEDDGYHLAELQKELQDRRKNSIANDSNTFNLNKVDENTTLESARTPEDISNRKVNAYQYDNPEVKPYFKEAAQELNYALNEGTFKGERFMRGDGTWGGQKFSSTPEITELHNDYKMSYKDLQRGIDGIIEDTGKENNAASKKVEVVIDKMLRNGYNPLNTNINVGPNQDYLNTLSGRPVNEQANVQVDEELPFFTNDEEMPKTNNQATQNNVQQETQTNENNNIPERKSEDVITLKNDNLETEKGETKSEDTGVSIGGKRVKVEVPTNSHKNKLGQNVTNNIDKAKVKKGDGDSKFYDTITERSQFVKEEVKEKISNDDFIKHYDKITNEATLDKAINKLAEQGTEAISDFFTNNKELTPDDIAMGIVLFEQSQLNGDYDMSNKVLRQLRAKGTTTGQIMQLYSLFSRMSPEGMYKYAGDQLLRAEEIFEKNKSKKWIEDNKNRWQLTPDEVEYLKSQMEKVQKLNNSTDTTAEVSLSTFGKKDTGKTIKVSKERATQLEIAKIQKMIEDKIPPERGQSLKAWMRISMLGNPKTIGTRNPLGNLLIKPVNDVGDVLGAFLDKAISKKTGVRTKGTPQVASSIMGFARGGKESIQDYKVGVNTRNISNNKFEVGQGKSFNEQNKGILAKQRNEASKILNKMDNGVTFVLDLGDRPFYEAAFENSLSNQMKLNGIDDIKNAPQWILDNAQQEALERTWQDDNDYTRGVLNIRKALNSMMHVGDYGIGDVLIPFAKTPANLTKAIVDYSPVGVGKALVQGNNLRKSISNGQFTPQMQHQFVNQLGKALAGSLLYVAASGLVKAGAITGSEDDDEDVADFMRNTLGIQPYSVKIGDKSFTYDWAQPVAAPFAITADLNKLLNTSKEERDLMFVLKSAIRSSGSILLEQSFLEGIKDVLGGYGDPVDNLLSEIEGLPARAVPTFFQQIATLVDGKQRMSYGNDGISNITSQAQAKIPGLASDLPVKRNTLGKEVERYGGKNTVFNVFFNPANYSEGKRTPSADEIYRVYQATNDKNILPRTVPSSLKNEDGTSLTNQQKSDFLKISGGIVDDNIQKLLNDDNYKKLTDGEKAKVIKYIVDYAYNKAREEITGHEMSGYKTTNKAINNGYALYEYYAEKVYKDR